MGRRELFPTDRGLQTRMALVGVLTPLAVVAAVVALLLVAEGGVLIGLAIVAAIGVSGALRARRRAQHARILAREEAPELHGMVERLCVVADVGKPEIVLEDQRHANSWVIDLPGRPPRLHVTRGLLDVLTPAELEAVVAHELSHVLHRDATVMSTVGLPGAVLLDGSRDFHLGWWPFIAAALFARAVGAASQVGVNALSRYRETHADATAARLTGRPAALASALLKLSGSAATIPSDDLRAVAAHNAFNLLPVEVDGEQGGRARRRLMATHPSVEQRVAALEELERRMHAARLSDRVLD